MPDNTGLVAVNLKRLRREAGVSQETLAAAAGISRTIIQKLETGKSAGAVPTLIRMAAALGVSPAEFFRPVVYASISKTHVRKSKRKKDPNA